MAPTAVSPPSSPNCHKLTRSEHFSPDTKHEVLPEHAEANPITPLRNALISEKTPLATRFRALFSLKHHASEKPPSIYTDTAIEAIAAAFSSSSALLKHELAYCLGQTRNSAAVPFLRGVLNNRGEDAMCRHEAAEALGALGDWESLGLLKEFRDDTQEVEVVRETCDIAVERIEWEYSCQSKAEHILNRFFFLKSIPSLAIGSSSFWNSDFTSIDPAPPLAQTAQPPSIPDLQGKLLDTRLPLFDRYRAMFALRDLSSPPNLPRAVPAVEALASGFSDRSALFRHEIAFVFGQLSHPASIPSLIGILSKKTEESMVRHEAAEALGSLGDEEGVEDVLKSFLDDPEQVVRESVIVALDMAEFEKNGEMEYAVLPGGQGFSPLTKIK